MNVGPEEESGNTAAPEQEYVNVNYAVNPENSDDVGNSVADGSDDQSSSGIRSNIRQ